MTAPVLRVVRGAGAGREIALQDELVIGREAAGDGRLDGEPALSRRHARFTRGADGALTIEDLGSLNGTRVNGERINAATALRRGDEIKLGETVLLVADPGDPMPRAARTDDTVLADVPIVPDPPTRPRPESAGADIATLAQRPAVRAGAVAGLVLVAVAAWLLFRGGDDSRETVVRDGRSSTVQLIVQPSAIVRRLARAVSSTAPPRSGSGIVVDARRGLILTADRLVAGAARISGRFGGGRTRGTTLVARSPCDGLALVRLPGLPDGARAAELGAAGSLARRDRVYALGYRGSRVGRGDARGGGLRAAVGAIAGGRARATLDPADPRVAGLVLHTARPGPGGAGGPLVDGAGEVVGLNLLPPDHGRISGALPIERAERVYADLATGRTRRDIGLRLEPWSEIRRGVGGLLVTGVDAGGAGRRASLSGRARRSARRPANPLLGATIFAVDGVSVNSAADVCRALSGVARGRRVGIRADVRSPVLAGGGLGRPSRGRAVTVRVRA
jgi:S1-C subfamily serine protease